MLEDLVRELADAKDPKSRERAYRQLERVGVDRTTAKIMVAALRKKGKSHERKPM